MFLKVLGISLIAVVLGIYLSSFKTQQKNHAGFPWQIEILATGHSRVFSLTIGQSTLADAETLFKEYAELTLFVPEKGEPVIEAFFNEVTIANFKSKMVMSMALPVDEIQAMFNRGARISTLGSGTRKVTLSGEDAIKVRQTAIASITYLPSAHLNAELIENRFGIPAEKIADTESDAIHWLYPDKGVDIALSETDKEVILYVAPDQFDTILQPLKLVNKID
jgi:hypothetical protein